MKTTNARNNEKTVENIAKNAIIEMQELTNEARRLARQLSREQLNELIAYYGKGV